ncbi:complex I subunit 4 family protein [Candidatus Kryptobacter tengchongensis]|uniref:complex I subunit 4 family protein n=1 Tax=Kryptobacter tengchongensis TaxID=1643429 RepID=UPI000707C2AA|nr:NADH-quinone oxidoreductase subunit M [Candidatus Kryptobacter tengchongensis]CUS78406.1 NADH dehydrogenase subunit M [Candidatus Kryptobacter tengchongensis]
MEWFQKHILSLIIFLPLLGALLISLINNGRKNLIKFLGIFFSTLTFVLSVYVFIKYEPQKIGFQFVEFYPWIKSLDIAYRVGIDGISLLLLVLTTFLTPVGLLSTWGSVEKRVKGYVIMFLLLETGMNGVFCAIDTFLFYIFWEVMLIPMYFIIGIWGGENRIYAAVKFVIYTMVGSLLMLVAIIALGNFALQINGQFTGDLQKLYEIAPKVSLNAQILMFLAFTLSFAIKVPLFPFHTWLPDAHVEAPTAGSVILAGVLLKMGTYGILRFSIPLFPDATFIFLPYIATLAVIGIIYGALVSFVQPDLKKLVAYSSVSHLGFVVLGLMGLTIESVQGGLIQMVNHGLSTGALFMLVGMIYDRRHTRMIEEFGGLARIMPIYATLFMIVALSSLGLPGLNGFVGEFLILLGSFKSKFLGTSAFAIFASTGVILAAVYLLTAYQRIFFGKVTKPENEKIKDLNLREAISLVLVLIFIVWIGIYPNTFLKKV